MVSPPVRTKLTRDEVGRLKVIARELHGQDNVHVVLERARTTQQTDDTRRPRPMGSARQGFKAQLQRAGGSGERPLWLYTRDG